MRYSNIDWRSTFSETRDSFAGLDISMDETYVRVLDRDGVVVRESKTISTAGAVGIHLGLRISRF